MRYSSAKQIIVSTLTRAPKQPVFLIGEPGVAKTSLCFDIGKKFNIPEKRTLLFRPSLRDPVDLMGAPDFLTTPEGTRTTVWASPEELYNFRKGTGPGLIIWDELPQAITQMQNAIAGALLDRVLGPLRIDDQVMQIATGNRTSDKAGANRIVSQLGNRVKFIDLEANIDDFCKWALGADIDPLLVAFLRLRPDMLQDFEADRRSNPTCRSWEMVSDSCDPALPKELFFTDVMGLVGEAAAVEYTAFRDMAARMPNIDAILLNPQGIEVPAEPAVLFACASALAYRASTDNFASLMKFMTRAPIEFSTMFVNDALQRHPKITSTKAFTDWAIENGEVFA